MSQVEYAPPILRGESLLRLRDVEEKTRLGRSTIYRYIKAGQFPRSVTLGVGTVRWKETEIEAWIASLTTTGAA